MNKLSKIAALAAFFAAASAAQAQVNFNANIELDPTSTNSRKTPATKSKTELGGRVELNAEATLVKQGDNFVNARASLILPVNGDKVGTDDLWMMMGNSSADFKVGRFEAMDLFPVGNDIVVAKALDAGYQTNKLRGRVSNKFHGALGANLAPGLRFELGVVAKNNSLTGTGNDFSGVRPALSYNAGPLTLRAGVEALKSTDLATAVTTSSTGVGMTGGYALTPNTTVYLNYGKNSKLDATSVGITGVIGNAGLNYVQDKTGNSKANTVYASYRMPLLGMKNAFWTPAISHSTGTAVDSVTAVRVRLNFGF